MCRGYAINFLSVPTESPEQPPTSSQIGNPGVIYKRIIPEERIGGGTHVRKRWRSLLSRFPIPCSHVSSNAISKIKVLDEYYLVWSGILTDFMSN